MGLSSSSFVLNYNWNIHHQFIKDMKNHISKYWLCKAFNSKWNKTLRPSSVILYPFKQIYRCECRRESSRQSHSNVSTKFTFSLFLYLFSSVYLCVWAMPLTMVTVGHRLSPFDKNCFLTSIALCLWYRSLTLPIFRDRITVLLAVNMGSLTAHNKGLQ